MSAAGDSQTDAGPAGTSPIGDPMRPPATAPEAGGPATVR